MNRRTLLAGGATVLGGAGAVYAANDSVQAGINDALAGLDREAAETAIWEGMNEIRFSQSVPELGKDELLTTVARSHSADMAERDFFSHRNPDGEDPSDRSGCQAGETLYRAELGEVESAETGETYNTRDSDSLAALVTESWRASRDHFTVITDGVFKNAGVGVHVADEKVFATALFC